MSHLQWARALGPGLVYAGAAVGVSHLVQSTKAGALYGLTLVPVIIAANLLKYPSFQYGIRYCSQTGEHLLHAYKNIGRWAVVFILVLTLLTMFTIQGAVTIVTAGIAQTMLPWAVSEGAMTTTVLLFCSTLLMFGRYAWLERAMKVAVVTLSLLTLVCLIYALLGPAPKNYFGPFDWSNKQDLLFFAALFGWMPAPLEITIWNSIWRYEDNALTGKNDYKEAQFDFSVGYWGTAILALGFVFLGALAMGNGEPMPESASAFAKLFISMYGDLLGGPGKVIVSVLAFLTMFSTTLTCLDAFPRVWREGVKQLAPSLKTPTWPWILATAVGTVIVLSFFQKDMKAMVTLATVLCFLTAPFIAWLNWVAVHGRHKARSTQSLSRWYGLFCVLTLGLFALSFVYWGMLQA